VFVAREPHGFNKSKGSFSRIGFFLSRTSCEGVIMGYGLRLAPMNRLERLLLLIAASMLLAELAFFQGTTITSL
jgi:hypothetical protein